MVKQRKKKQKIKFFSSSSSSSSSDEIRKRFLFDSMVLQNEERKNWKKNNVKRITKMPFSFFLACTLWKVYYLLLFPSFLFRLPVQKRTYTLHRKKKHKTKIGYAISHGISWSGKRQVKRITRMSASFLGFLFFSLFLFVLLEVNWIDLCCTPSKWKQKTFSTKWKSVEP